jgi:hypothetical protein
MPFRWQHPETQQALSCLMTCRWLVLQQFLHIGLHQQQYSGQVSLHYTATLGMYTSGLHAQQHICQLSMHSHRKVQGCILKQDLEASRNAICSQYTSAKQIKKHAA